jgi:hypothetical protein
VHEFGVCMHVRVCVCVCKWYISGKGPGLDLIMYMTCFVYDMLSPELVCSGENTSPE